MLMTTEPDPFGILDATRGVLENARFVTMHPEAVPRAVEAVTKYFGSRLVEANRAWPKVAATFADCVQFVFLEDVVNFSFWADPKKETWCVEWPKGNFVRGWYALDACFRRALRSNARILNARYLADMPYRDAKEFFMGVGGIPIPMECERLVNLCETGVVLLQYFDGHFRSILEEARYDAIALVRLLRFYFSSFNDQAMLYNERDGMAVCTIVPFLKRAQICAYNLSDLAEHFPLFNIINTDQLTAFADYRIPQILRALGMIVYSDKLAAKVGRGALLKPGSREEIEIRSATVWGVELIRQNIPHHTAAQIDNALWMICRDRSAAILPHHRTRTIFY
ncbi:MAG: queuosine salvage family protein [Patescibacteria group bacterium]